MTERLHFYFSLSCIGEGNGNPLQCSCLENPRDGRAWWAAIYGVAQSQTRLKWLSSSSRDYLDQSPQFSEKEMKPRKVKLLVPVHIANLVAELVAELWSPALPRKQWRTIAHQWHPAALKSLSELIPSPLFFPLGFTATFGILVPWPEIEPPALSSESLES